MADVIFIERVGYGEIVLNRPNALNALNLEMAEQITEKLLAWQEQEEINSVVIKGAGGRAFCAGGDIRVMHAFGKSETLPASDSLQADFFRKEYGLNKLIHHYPKPYVAITDGITMGGGMGLSIHGDYRIGTDKTIMAMPETSIGFFPDVGGGYFLSRLKGEFGTFLGLTGMHITAGDAKYVGLLSHEIPSSKFENFFYDLERTLKEENLGEHMQALAQRYEAKSKSEMLEPNEELINRCFRFNSVEEIIAALMKEEGEDEEKDKFVQHVLTTLSTKSPMSLKVTLAQLRRAKNMDIDETFDMEFNLSQHFMTHPDFFEGVRALLIDKDRKPFWQPQQLEEISDDMVESFFN